MITKLELFLLTLVVVFMLMMLFNSEENRTIQTRYEECVNQLPFKSGPGDATYKGE